jgi:hypothetical protein
MNLNNLEKLTNIEDARLTLEQKHMAEYNINKGFEAFIEDYSNYTYVVLIKEGVRNGIKRLNRTGHDTYVS